MSHMLSTFSAASQAAGRRSRAAGFTLVELLVVIAIIGTLVGTFLTGQATANCAFGDDGKTLYMTADSHLCRTRLLTTGPLPGP
jgi:prepilin-type N-terminal cleavage/methylation domain-containing protein